MAAQIYSNSISGSGSSTAEFTGTTAELEQALANGELKVGQTVNITDDEPDGLSERVSDLESSVSAANLSIEELTQSTETNSSLVASLTTRVNAATLDVSRIGNRTNNVEASMSSVNTRMTSIETTVSGLGSTATTSANGLMSSTDKTKLDNVKFTGSITFSTSAPTSSNGADGDVWFVYQA